MHELAGEIDRHMEAYDLQGATRPIVPFLDDASNWYVRRSRRRFWKSEDDNDKSDAYRTLHYVLLKLSVILAPFVPFLAEELYQKLGGGEESVHLLSWPTNYAVDEGEIERMRIAREIINEGLSQRASVGIKVRQPIPSLTYTYKKLDSYYEQIIAEEVNVKQVAHRCSDDCEVQLDVTLTPELKREGLAREVVRFVQNARKSAGLNVDDRIELSLTTDDDELTQAIDEHAGAIRQETLAIILDSIKDGYEVVALVEGKSLNITLKKSITCKSTFHCLA